MKKATHERLQATIAGVKQAAVSLWQRLQPYSFLLDGADGAHLARMKDRADAEVQRDTVKSLSLSETLLTMMLEVLSGTHETGVGRFVAGGGGLASGQGGGNGQGHVEDSSDVGSMGNTADSTTCASSEDVPSMPNNIRVRSDAQRAGAECMGMGEGDPDGPRFPRSSRGGGAEGAGCGNGTGTSSRGDDGTHGPLEGDDEQAMEDMVPTRTFLKMCSSRQHTETIRKREMDERKKKLAERMEAADEAEKATLTSKLARKRQQDLAMVRRRKGYGIVLGLSIGGVAHVQSHRSVAAAAAAPNLAKKYDSITNSA